MDEVDGRPGSVALQSGFLEDPEDAPQDAPKLFLRHAYPLPQILKRKAILRKAIVCKSFCKSRRTL
jgi:hypothetical protein